MKNLDYLIYASAIIGITSLIGISVIMYIKNRPLQSIDIPAAENIDSKNSVPIIQKQNEIPEEYILSIENIKSNEGENADFEEFFTIVEDGSGGKFLAQIKNDQNIIAEVNATGPSNNLNDINIIINFDEDVDGHFYLDLYSRLFALEPQGIYDLDDWIINVEDGDWDREGIEVINQETQIFKGSFNYKDITYTTNEEHSGILVNIKPNLAATNRYLGTGRELTEKTAVGDYSAAIEEYNKSIEEGYQFSQLQRAKFYYGIGEYEKSLADFNTIEAIPDFSLFDPEEKALVLYKKGEIQNAIDYATKKNLQVFLAGIYIAEKNPQKAIEIYKVLINQDLKKYQSYFPIIKLYTQLNDKGNSLKHSEELLKICTYDICHKYKGDVHFYFGEYDKALPYYNKYAEGKESFSESYYLPRMALNTVLSNYEAVQKDIDFIGYLTGEAKEIEEIFLHKQGKSTTLQNSEPSKIQEESPSIDDLELKIIFEVRTFKNEGDVIGNYAQFIKDL